MANRARREREQAQVESCLGTSKEAVESEQAEAARHDEDALRTLERHGGSEAMKVMRRRGVLERRLGLGQPRLTVVSLGLFKLV